MRNQPPASKAITRSGKSAGSGTDGAVTSAVVNPADTVKRKLPLASYWLMKYGCEVIAPLSNDTTFMLNCCPDSNRLVVEGKSIKSPNTPGGLLGCSTRALNPLGTCTLDKVP